MIVELSLFQRNLICKGAFSIDRPRKDEYRLAALKLAKEKLIITEEESERYVERTPTGVKFPPITKPIDLTREEILLINAVLSTERFTNSEEDVLVEIEKLLDQALGRAAQENPPAPVKS